MQHFFCYQCRVFSTAFLCKQFVIILIAKTDFLQYFVAVFLEKGKPLMLVRKAEIGKQVVLSAKVIKLSGKYTMVQVPCSYYTTSRASPSEAVTILVLQWAWFSHITVFCTTSAVLESAKSLLGRTVEQRKGQNPYNACTASE